jgi:hypothetical protein
MSTDMNWWWMVVLRFRFEVGINLSKTSSVPGLQMPEDGQGSNGLPDRRPPHLEYLDEFHLHRELFSRLNLFLANQTLYLFYDIDGFLREECQNGMEGPYSHVSK